jgi:hypothetical protein
MMLGVIGHMVVSRAKLNETMSAQFSSALKSMIQQLRIRGDEALFRAHDVFERDRLEIGGLLKTIVEGQHQKLADLVQQYQPPQAADATDATAPASGSNTNNTTQELLAQISELLRQQRTELDILFTNPYFQPNQSPPPTLQLDEATLKSAIPATTTTSSSSSSSSSSTPTATSATQSANASTTTTTTSSSSNTAPNADDDDDTKQ